MAMRSGRIRRANHMTEAEMRKLAVRGGAGVVILVSALYMGALLGDAFLLVLPALGLGFWMVRTSRRATLALIEMQARAKAEGVAVPLTPVWAGGVIILPMAALILLPFCRLLLPRAGLPVLPTLAAGWIVLVVILLSLTRVRLKSIRDHHARLGSSAAGAQTPA